MTPNPSQRLLALETSGDQCGLALMENGRIVVEHTFLHRMHLSERLMGLTDTLLAEAGFGLRDLDAFAVGIGPGSFTGTRIGVMTAKTWAHLLRRPLFGGNSLEMLAFEYRGIDRTVVAVSPCRPGMVYVGAYAVETNIPHPQITPAAVPLEELPNLLTEVPEASRSRLLLCGEGAMRYRAELTALLPNADLVFGAKTEPYVGSLAQLAWNRWMQGEAPDDALALNPLYLAPPPISQSKQPIPQPTPEPDPGD